MSDSGRRLSGPIGPEPRVYPLGELVEVLARHLPQDQDLADYVVVLGPETFEEACQRGGDRPRGYWRSVGIMHRGRALRVPIVVREDAEERTIHLWPASDVRKAGGR
jgi:hypothetical protein